ncbi:hypothetical protein PSHT_08017 [Puccinia striiformis]|uniref:FAR1 domain-containing protein n=1 Tax=Puccinia striiformis TaxID=27350 RepID=A0A2S4VT36_9BASI|nr:hypothetical protein PSHT_08017 [Puccinia striiformis]
MWYGITSRTFIIFFSPSIEKSERERIRHTQYKLARSQGPIHATLLYARIGRITYQKSHTNSSDLQRNPPTCTMKPDPEPQTMTLKTAPEPETVMLQLALEHQTVALETEKSPKSSIPLKTAPEPPTVMLKPPLEQPTSALETAEPPKPAAELELLSSTLESRPEDSRARETTSSAFPIIPPPPEKNYDTKEAMAESIQNWACNHGFAIVVGNSDFTRGENRIKYQCDRSGHYRPHRPNKPVDPKNPVKLTKSRKINCPFSMNAVLNADNISKTPS